MNQAGSVESYWLNDTLQCYSKNSLVYVRIIKNASTFYTDLFTVNGWTQINFQDIDWKNNLVFGFIQDPVVRFCKGLTEDLYHNVDLQQKVLPLLDQSMSNVLVLTFHTMPISLICGDQMYNMTWIPIDTNIPSEKEVNNLCNAHNVSLAWNNSYNHHSSFPEKIEFFNNMMSLLGNGTSNFWKLFSKDIDLYHQVVINQQRHNDPR